MQLSSAAANVDDSETAPLATIVYYTTWLHPVGPTTKKTCKDNTKLASSYN